MIEETFNQLLSYLKNPKPFIKTDKSKIFYNQLFPLVIIALSFAFSSVIFVSVLEKLHLIRKMPEFDLFDLKEKKLMLFLMVTVLAPIVEELIFRYQLKSYSLAVILYGVLVANLLYRFTEGYFLFIAILLTALACVSLIIFLFRNKTKRYQFIKQIFPYHFYFTAICFGLVHISNYKDPFEYGFPIVLLVLPQLFAGLILGYVRMRFGLDKSMMMHAAYNLIPALTFLAGY